MALTAEVNPRMQVHPILDFVLYAFHPKFQMISSMM